jgi:hypothetical protein
MERMWVFAGLAVSVAEVDFLDPALGESPDVRERGVRVEVRPAEAASAGSVYASPGLTLRPAVCRIDLLESRPGAQDRMHWHPVMHAGDPDDRVFDDALSADPLLWLGQRLRAVDELLATAGGADPALHREDVAAIARAADEIVASARDGLARMRAPWPVVERDERGMAVT